MKPSLIFQQILWGGLTFLCHMAAGQTEIFRETMGRDDNLPYEGVTIEWYESQDLFDNDELTMTKGGVANGALITKNSQSPTTAGFSKYSNVFFGSGISDCGFAIEGIDASQYLNLKVKFGYRKEHSLILPAINLSYWNGEEYVEVSFSFNELDDAAKAWYHSPIIDLPADAQRNDLKLRWVNSGTTGFRLDDVVLMGDPCSPVLVPCPTTLPEFNTFSGDESTVTQSFLITGLNFNPNDLTIIAPEGFLISENLQGNFFPTLILPDYNGMEKEIWVRMNENSSPGYYEGQITISGGNAEVVHVDLSGWHIKKFDIPYHNCLRTENDLTMADKQGFQKQNVAISPNYEGYLGFCYDGYIITPEIVLSPHSHLNISFQTCTHISGSSIKLRCSIHYSDGQSEDLFLVTPPNSTTFTTTNKIIDLENNENQITAKIKLQKTDNEYTFIRFRELSIRDLSDWTGTESTDWNTESNWTLGVPGIKSEVIIPSALNNPVLDGEGFAGDLTLAENATLTINPQGRLSIGGSLTNPNGTAGLVIEDGGSLIHPNAGVPATVKRNIAAANWTDCTDGWHLISAPVENQAIEGGWTPTDPGNDYDFFAWSEPQQLWLNQKESGNEMSRFIPGEGYLVAYQQGGTKIFAGNLTVGDITRTLTLTGDDDFSGWNLLGNPYPSGLRWNHDTGIWGDLQALNINAYAHTWDAVAKSYTVVPPGGFIPAGQGFMVQLTGGESADLTLPTAARAHEGPPEDRSAANGWIRLAAFEQDNASKQECLLMINPAATETYQPYWDAHFLQGFAPQFYSLKNDEKLTVFSMPEIDMDQAIPLGFVKNEAGAFRINLLENNTTESLFLYDIKLDTEQVLSLDNPYLFTAEADDDPLRFELRFKSANTTGIERQIQEGAEVYTSGKVLFLKFLVEENGRTLEVFDPGGRRLLAKPLSEGRQHSISLDLEAGLYIVRLRAKRWTVSKKIFVI